MTPVSRYKLAKEDEERVLSALESELLKIASREKLRSLLALLVSPSERLMLAKRMAAFVMIEKGLPDSQVSRSLHLTRITVAKLRFAYLLAKEKKEPVTQIIRSKQLNEILKPMFKEVVFKYILPAALGKIPK